MPSLDQCAVEHDVATAPKVSVIVPMYNVEEFLERCLDSIEAQTLNDIEVILVDDCSTDNTRAIATEYVARNKSWRITHNKINRGLSVARNVGMELAQGDFIGFVDSDDWVEPTMFETLLNTALSTKSDIAQVQYELRSVQRGTPLRQNNDVCVMSGVEALEKMLLSEKYAVWFMLYKRNLFAGEVDRFPEGLTCEDRVFNSVFLPKAHRVAASSRIEYYYFQNLGSLSHSGLNTRGLDLLEADKRVVANVAKLNDSRLLKLARDRAAKGSYSLLVKWARFGVTDPQLNGDEVLALLWGDFRANYQSLMRSHLSLLKKAVAWQLRYCPSLLKLEFSLHNAITQRK